MSPSATANITTPRTGAFTRSQTLPRCGPQLECWSRGRECAGPTAWGVRQAAIAVRAGEVLALKGLGGFQLLVDARNEQAVRCLRDRKQREEKPFALMFPSLDAVRQLCEVSPLEERLLRAPEAPIVLLRRRQHSRARRRWPCPSRRGIRIWA